MENMAEGLGSHGAEGSAGTGLSRKSWASSPVEGLPGLGFSGSSACISNSNSGKGIFISWGPLMRPAEQAPLKRQLCVLKHGSCQL